MRAVSISSAHVLIVSAFMGRTRSANVCTAVAVRVMAAAIGHATAAAASCLCK
jgi:hypothetical protein